MSRLTCEIIGSRVEPYAASPLLSLRLRITEESGRRIDTIALKAQIQIDPRKRKYTPSEERKLSDLFGETHRWGETLRAVHWTHAAIMVPPFSGSTEIDIPIPCTYDFEIASSKYFDALEDGEVPLLLLFSGMMFPKAEQGFSAEMVPWDLECSYRMPAKLWRETMDQYFPNQAWIRIDKDSFDELYRFKREFGFLSWEQTLQKLFESRRERV
ncbi:MAG: DUF6084 family protein [Candidatus Eremiobacteraeota bacterium]|nr:DUF6084 family protein [Candidatus Eremiobacteraeota bacterium]